MKHLGFPKAIIYIYNDIVRYVIRLIWIKRQIGRATYLLRYERAYIVATAEIGVPYELTKYTNTLTSSRKN